MCVGYKVMDWILKSKNELCISLLNKSIQDLSDHGMSKGPKNPLWVPLTHDDLRDLGLICLVKKHKIHFRILLDFLKETHPICTSHNVQFQNISIYSMTLCDTVWTLHTMCMYM